MENQPTNSGEKLWRQRPSDAEREALQRQPELAAEARLTAALSRLPDAPLANNFTSRVLAAVELEDRHAARASRRRWHWRSLLPHLAVATAVVAFIGIGWQRYAADQQRQAIAKSLAMVASTHTVPSVDALENLDAIQRMSQSGHADGELLAALQ